MPDKLKELLHDWGKYEEETGTVFGPPLKWGDRSPLLPDQIGGDVVEDQKAWMRVGKGKSLMDS